MSREGSANALGQNSLSRESMIALWLVVGTFFCYFATAPVVAQITGQAMWVTPVWSAQADYPIGLRLVVLLFGLAGVAIASFVPAVAWALTLAGGRLRAASLFHRAFILNLVQATAFISLWKAFEDGVPSRPIFIAWQALVAGSGLLVMFRASRRDGGRPVDISRPLLIGGIVLLLLLPGFLWGKTFVEDASGDGMEAFEFSRSLATYQLPHWDLENGYYGFYPSFMLFAYPAQLSFISIGETEAGQRLLVFFYLFGIYLVLSELVRSRRRRLSTTEILLLVGAVVYFLVYHAYHSTYELVGDLAEPPGVDIFLTFLATSAFYELVLGHRVWWGLLALFASMATAAGLPFALLFLLGRLFTRRFRFLRAALQGWALDALAFLIPWTGYQLLVSWYSKFHPLGITKWAFENLFHRYAFQLQPMIAVVLAAKFAFVVAVVPLVALAFVARRDKIVRMLGVAVTGYFVLLVVFGRTHPHYLIPLSLFPAAILLRTLAKLRVGPRARKIGHLAYGAVPLGTDDPRTASGPNGACHIPRVRRPYSHAV